MPQVIEGTETTPEERAEVLMLAAKATPGPWRYEQDWTWELYGTNGDLIGKIVQGSSNYDHQNDAAFIAHANPDFLKRLLADFAELERRDADQQERITHLGWRLDSDNESLPQVKRELDRVREVAKEMILNLKAANQRLRDRIKAASTLITDVQAATEYDRCGLTARAAQWLATDDAEAAKGTR